MGNQLKYSNGGIVYEGISIQRESEKEGEHCNCP